MSGTPERSRSICIDEAGAASSYFVGWSGLVLIPGARRRVPGPELAQPAFDKEEAEAIKVRAFDLTKELSCVGDRGGAAWL